MTPRNSPTALVANVSPGTEIAASFGTVPGRDVTTLADLMATPLHPRLDAMHEAIGPDTIAKFLLTSGSTGNPKAVINTQRMICANQVMLRETLAFLKDEPPVIVDWLPWNHTFGGNHNIGLTLYNGGSMYLDEGKPMPGGIEETVRNLQEISPTVYFNVPKGYESLLPYLRDDEALRKKFFARLHAMFFWGAALSAFVWNSLDELSVRETGYRVPMLTGLGATETSPFFMSVNPLTSRSGHVGLPVLGNDAKLVPNNGKLEVRAKGPNVMPGYWRQPDLTAKAFDEEGFYKFGDALKPADPDNFDAGFDFDGRIGEDFKLASGTWVSVGPLRARFVAACAPLVRDVVIAGINRDEISALVVLDLDGCRLINPTLPSDDLAAAASDPLIVAAFRERFQKLLASATGSSTRITRAILLDTPLSIDRGEVTDKGSINQRAVLENRSALIEEIYSPAPPAQVITLSLNSKNSLSGRTTMQLKDQAAIVTGGASGLGAATARRLAAQGAKVAVCDLNAKLAETVAAEIGGVAVICDVSDAASAEAAIAKAAAAHGPARVLVNCAGIGVAKRVIGKEGPMALGDFDRVIKVNLIGSFNMLRLATAGMSKLEPLATGERGVVISTASVAAYDGQIGQSAYSASKGGIVAMTLPIARELAQFGIRVLTIAPGLFLTPLLANLPQEAQDSLAASIPFPRRLGQADEFASLALHMIDNPYLNGEVVRLDAALRMAPR